MVLVCVGRREFRDGLGVEEVGVAMDGRKIQAGLGQALENRNRMCQEGPRRDFCSPHFFHFLLDI